MHVLVRDYLGYEPPKPPVNASTEEATGDLAAALASTPVRKAPAVDDSAWKTFAGHNDRHPSNSQSTHRHG